MSSSEDTEITLGTGKMLGLFFGLVALCSVFFGMGFKVGKNSAAPAAAGDSAVSVAASNGGVRPSAVRQTADSGANASPDVAFYKPDNSPRASLEPASAGAEAAAAANNAPSGAGPSDGKTGADPAVAPPVNGYYVQVAAVSKQEDGDALVDALKKKQYPAFSSPGPDKLFHVQVGPFVDLRNAEETRSKLVTDGYNPILKK
jgi:cell division septation protein DedD